MLDKIYHLKKHLERQIKEADKVGSDWVYIRKTEAKMCLELAEAEETFINTMEKENV